MKLKRAEALSRSDFGYSSQLLRLGQSAGKPGRPGYKLAYVSQEGEGMFKKQLKSCDLVLPSLGRRGMRVAEGSLLPQLVSRKDLVFTNDNLILDYRDMDRNNKLNGIFFA